LKTKGDLKKEYKETSVPMGVFLLRNMKTNQFVLGASRNLAGSINMYKFVLKMGKVTDPLFKNSKVLEDYRAQGENTFEFKGLDNLIQTVCLDLEKSLLDPQKRFCLRTFG
jgi:hypothetical protein